MTAPDHAERLRKLVRLDTNALVRAGAGTGKTFSLVSCVLHLLAGLGRGATKVSPGRICAITFTEKAAAEMQTRIRDKVLDLMDNPACDDILVASARDRDMPLPGSAHWRRIHRDLGSMAVTTFHGFCAQVLREVPVEAGIEPGFGLADQMLSGGLLSETVESVVYERLARNDGACLRALSALPIGTGSHGANLVEFISRVLRRTREDGLSPQDMALRWPRPDAAGLAALHTRRLKELAHQKQLLVRLWDKLDSNKLAGGNVSDRVLLSDLKTFVRRADRLQREVEALPAEALSDHMPTLSRYVKPIRRKARQARVLGQNARFKIFSLPTFQDRYLEKMLQHTAEHLRADFLEILDEVDGRYAERKSAMGVLDFTDLLLMARRVLRDMPDVRRRMKRRFEVLLVDEFQDTNGVQLDLIAMLGETREHEQTFGPLDDISKQIELAPDQLFLVGDPKQSIYTFRGADVAVWNAVRRRLVEEQKIVTETALQQNHRSGPGLLAFGNHWFPDVLGRRDVGDPDYVVRFDDKDVLDPARAESHRDRPVEFLAISEKAGPEVEARAVARWIQRYSRGDNDYAVYNGLETRQFSDIAILLRQFRHLSVFQDALQRLRIPHYVVKGRGFYGCPEIRDLHLALRLLLDPDDGLALIGVLRSPLFLVSDAGLIWLQRGARGRGRTPLTVKAVKEAMTRLEGSMTDEDKAAVRAFVEIWRRLEPQADRLGPRGILDALVQLTHIREKLAGTFRGRQKIGNIEKLIGIAEHYERTTHGQLSGFATRLHELIETEPREPEGQVVEETADAVRIMTIHQSKGLEFPVVMIPQLHTMADRRLGGSPIQYDRDHGLQVRLRVRHMGQVIADVETDHYEDLRKTIKAREDAEEKRLVYVAVTRARDLLWLSGRGMAMLVDGGRSAVRQDNPLTALQTRINLDDPVLTSLVRERFLSELMASIPEDDAALAEEVRAEADPRWPEAIERAVAQSWRREQGPASTTVAAAQLADFHRCPQRYLLWYVMGLRDGEDGEDSREWASDGAEGPQAILDRGTAAHAALERLDFEAYAEGDAFERRWWIERALRSREIWLPSEERAEVTESLVAMLDGSGWVGELAAAQAEGRLAREVPFVLHAAHGEDEVFIKGRIDMLLGGEEGSLAIIDHKYSGRSEAGLGPHAFQLRLYALAARTLYGGEGGWEAGVVFLREPGARPEMIGGNPEELEAFRDELPGLARRLVRSRRTGLWPRQAPDGRARTAGRCRSEGCSFAARCFPGPGSD